MRPSSLVYSLFGIRTVRLLHSTPKSSIGIAYGDDSAVCGRSFHLASRIKTFTEKHEDGAMIDAIRARIRAAEKSVVLGFGNYKQNLELVQPNGPRKIKSIVGTGFRSVVRECLASWSKGRACKIEVRSAPSY